MHTKAFVLWDLDKMLYAMEFLHAEMQRRVSLMLPLKDQGKAGNIINYNKFNENDTLPNILVVIDEFLTLMPKSTDLKKKKETKAKIIDYLEEIAQIGGALGVTYIISHQKPVRDLMPPFLKNMTNIRICFGVTDPICSEIMLDNRLAVGLPQGIAYCSINGECDLLYTTFLPDIRIVELIKPYKDPKHKNIFDDKGDFQISVQIPENKEKSTGRTLKVLKSKEAPNITFNRLEQSSNETLEENINKIPGFIPYNPPNPNAIIVDQTGIPLVTQKPLKGGKQKC
jgi:S-DNA-T family DNA segregation ATPase FtsK/SpoIIIE